MCFSYLWEYILIVSVISQIGMVWLGYTGV